MRPISSVASSHYRAFPGMLRRRGYAVAAVVADSAIGLNIRR
jgi:hypothetical protein